MTFPLCHTASGLLSNRLRRAAILINAPWVHGSIDMCEYGRCLTILGYETIIICKDRAEFAPSYTVVTANSSQLKDPNFYASLNLDVALVFCWLQDSNVVSAIKAAGIHVILRGDTDGQISVRLFPAATLKSSVTAESGLLVATRCFKHWIVRYLMLEKLEVADKISCMELADSVVVESEEARRNVKKVLLRYGGNALSSKVTVIPHFISEGVRTAELGGGKRKRILAIGKWGATQKNALLLAKSIDLFLRLDPSFEVLIVGRDGDEVFGPLATRWRQVNYMGPVPHEHMAAIMAETQIFFSASRWEGYCIAAVEALAMGCSIAATPVPSFIDICDSGRFGTISTRYTSHSLVDALLAETTAWAQGGRNPVEIAAYWRPRLSSIEIVKALLASYEASHAPCKLNS